MSLRYLLPVTLFSIASLACSSTDTNDGGGGTSTAGGAGGHVGHLGGGGHGGDPAPGAGGTGGGPAASGGAGGEVAGGGSGGTGGGSGGEAATGGAGGESMGGGGMGGGGMNGGAMNGGAMNGGSGGMPATAFEFLMTPFEHKDGCGAEGTGDPKRDGTPLTCSAFPKANTGYGGHIPPKITWSAGPEGTQSYVLVLWDLSNNGTHWVLWNIPANVLGIDENLPKGRSPANIPGSDQISSFNNDSYAGPGAAKNVYEFKLYAMKTATIANPPAMTSAFRTLLDGSPDVLKALTFRGRSDKALYDTQM